MNPIALIHLFLLSPSSPPSRILLHNSDCIIDVLKRDSNGGPVTSSVPTDCLVGSSSTGTMGTTTKNVRSYWMCQRQNQQNEKREEQEGLQHGDGKAGKGAQCEHHRQMLEAKLMTAMKLSENGGLNNKNTNAGEKSDFSFTSSINVSDDEGLRLTVALPNPNSAQAMSSTRLAASVQEIKKTNIGTRLILSDDVMNIWEFCIDPGERCEFHSHVLPYLFVNLTKSLTQALDRKGLEIGKPSMQKIGQITFVDEHSLGSHAVRNVGKETFLQFVVEFKQFHSGI